MGEPGAIDCDVHPTVPDNKALLPYLDEFWRDSIVSRGINSLETISYPTKSPLASRPEWRDKSGFAATDPAQLADQVFGRWQAGTAILNCIYGVHLVYSEDMAKAFASAVNDWLVKEWLDRDSRLRASIVVPMQNVEYAVDEIERCAKDKRFVQVLVMAMQEVPLGRRHFWPIYAACERHGLRSASTPARLPQSGDRARLADLVHRGLRRPGAGLPVPAREPDHRGRVRQAPRAEGGADRIRGDLAAAIPVAVSPSSGGASHRGALGRPLAMGDRARPFPPDHSAAGRARGPHVVERAIEHLRSDDILLYASDFPHWQFDGDAVLPAGLSPALRRKLAIDNPLATYSRLAG